MTIELYNVDNMKYYPQRDFDIIYCDMIYENRDLRWINKYWDYLKHDSIFIIQTDWHTDWLIRYHMEWEMKGWVNEPIFINHLVQKNEWGNHPSRSMHQCYDSILIYANGKDYKFYSDRIQVDKITKNKGLNPSGRTSKQATAWIDDICLTTTSKERIKKEDGHLIKWQKPLKLFDRIFPQFCNTYDWIFEPFGGTFSACRWAKMNKRHAIGLEIDPEIFEIGKKAVEETNELPIQVQEVLF